MTTDISRREFVSLIGLGLALPVVNSLGAEVTAPSHRIRTITAGIQLQNTLKLDQARAAVAFLKQSREAFVAEGYEVQTLRIATQPLHEYMPDWTSASSL